MVLESTTAPGPPTRSCARSWRPPASRGKDFLRAVSPECEDPGRKDFTTLYGVPLQTVQLASPARVAESTKLLENVFRSVNIALVSELTGIFDRIGVDVWGVIRAAETKPFGFMAYYYPGPGLGGHGIPLHPDTFSGFDAVVVAAVHDAFMAGRLYRGAELVVGTRNIVSPALGGSGRLGGRGSSARYIADSATAPPPCRAGRDQRHGKGTAMSPDKKPSLLFAAYMAGGNGTILQNLEDAIRGRPDVDSAWLRVEMDAESNRLDQRPRRPLIPGTIRNSLVTGDQIRRLERTGASFDAAYFFQQTICMFLWRFRRRVPYVVALDGTPLWYAKHQLWYAQQPFDPRSLGSKVKHELVRRVYDRAFHLLPLSWSCRDSLIQDYGIPPERITVVPPGINLRTYICPDREATGPERPLNLLFVGADFKRKGGDLLVALAARPEFADLQFHFVTMAYAGPRAANVHVYGDVTTNSPRMLALLGAADLFVLPTRADSHSIASLEAMAMGLPVIATPVGGIVDVIEEGKTGYLVPRDDLAALAHHIWLLRQSRELRVRLGLNGRRRVESHFNGENIAATVVDLLKGAAASKPSKK